MVFAQILLGPLADGESRVQKHAVPDAGVWNERDVGMASNAVDFNDGVVSFERYYSNRDGQAHCSAGG